MDKLQFGRDSCSSFSKQIQLVGKYIYCSLQLPLISKPRRIHRNSQMSIHLQQQRPTKLDQMDQCIQWLKLATQQMDLGGFHRMIAGIEQLSHTQLTAWKEAFTSTFLSSLKQTLKPHSSVSPRKALLVSSISNFAVFMSIHDAFQQEASANTCSESDAAFLEAFFEFCNGYPFVLTADVETVARELDIAVDEQRGMATSEFFGVAMELLRNGAQLSELVDDLKSMEGLDVNRRS